MTRLVFTITVLLLAASACSGDKADRPVVQVNTDWTCGQLPAYVFDELGAYPDPFSLNRLAVLEISEEPTAREGGGCTWTYRADTAFMDDYNWFHMDHGPGVPGGKDVTSNDLTEDGIYVLDFDDFPPWS